MANEKRDLIDRGRLLRDPYFQEGRYPESHLLRMAIKEHPTVDAVEVVHGRWIPCENGGYHCSNCDRRVAFLVHKYYCPNCGAKMDGGLTDAQ